MRMFRVFFFLFLGGYTLLRSTDCTVCRRLGTVGTACRQAGRLDGRDGDICSKFPR